MKYLLKALTTNNRDLRTAVCFVINDAQYLFSCPDGFQRMANLQKLKFQKVKGVFVPSLATDHFSGLPGFFLSAREAMNADQSSLDKLKMTLVAPEGAKDKMYQGINFMGYYLDHMEIKEFANGALLG